MPAPIAQDVRTSHKRRHTGVAVLLCVVGAAAAFTVAVGISTVSSLDSVKSSALMAQRDSARIEAALEKLDIEAAKASTGSLETSLSSIEEQFDGWEWDVVGTLGIHADDIDGARSLVAMGDDLVSNVLDPLLDVASDYQEAISADSVSALLSAIQADGLNEVVQSAEPHVRSAQESLLSLPSFTIDELNEAAEGLSGVVSELAAAYDVYDDASQKVDSVAHGLRDAASDVRGAADSVASALGLSADE